MLHQPEESAEHLTRRLESFSDIVIGFSLAELTINLAIPHGIKDFEYPIWLIGYAWTFFVVSHLWLSHHRLFVLAFVPTRLTLVLNFVWLATIGLLVYLVQAYVHFLTNEPMTRAIYSAYFALYALNIAIMAILYALGSRQRDVLGDDAQNSARQRAGVYGGAAAIVFAAVIAGPFMPFQAFAFVVPWSIGYAFLIVLLARRAWKRAHRPAEAV